MSFITQLEFWEFLSYLVTVLGLPLAALAVWREMHAERINEVKEMEQREDNIYVELSRQYSMFLESVLTSPELNLMGNVPSESKLSSENKQKRIVYYEMLIALFERAFILLYEENLENNALRRWNSWADYMAWWLAKSDFRDYVSHSLQGEDPEFSDYIRGLIQEAEIAVKT